jgi:hypothetical protein
MSPGVLLGTTEEIMAPEAMEVIIGVDVCKDRLDLSEYHSERAYSISNDAAAIKAWLDGFAGRLKLALEPTSHDHPVLDGRVKQPGRWKGHCKLLQTNPAFVPAAPETACVSN